MQINTFDVVPALPPGLEPLRELAFNLLWMWDAAIREAFIWLDRELWEKTGQNPVLLLGLISQQRLEEAANDESFMALLERSHERQQSYLDAPTWWQKRYSENPLVAYFSLEFGIAECLPIYSGGLGVLAGDHLKSASDLGVPLIAVGLLYQEGYFRQYLTSDGWQQESYPTNDFYNLPVQVVEDPSGAPLRVRVEIDHDSVLVQVWRVDVGRVPLYLLDTNLPENPRQLQDITDQLYGGDQETRIRQEIVLGVGGMRALAAMGLEPDVCHMNEGHSAFLALERVRVLVKQHQLSFTEALQAVRAGSVFTTHTPVPAGFDAFPPELISKHFGHYIDEVGISLNQLLALGRIQPGAGAFNMAALALRTSAFANGVSKLHGEVSRRLLGEYLPGVPQPEVPVGHVTNGAHTRSVVSQEMAGLFDRYLSSKWWRHPGQASTWKGVDDIPAEELWATHERRRERLVVFARIRLLRQLAKRGASELDQERAKGVLNTRALTIGFARRFATYKRADLLLHDLERLRRILLDPERPVQIIFAGKAHPQDHPGKEMLKAVVGLCQTEEFRRHAVFLEDYDLMVARYLVQGVDVWLNTPRRGMEASGTSGMKVLANGGLNLSTLDGWWVEGYGPDVGWAIGKGESYLDHGYQDYVESNALYDLLEHDIVPLFYNRQLDGIPRGWIARMKQSMKQLTPQFSSNRMIWEYGENYYLPAARYQARLAESGYAQAKALEAWRTAVSKGWSGVAILEVTAQRSQPHQVGEGFALLARVRLGSISPEDVVVQSYYGPLDSHRVISDAKTVPMQLEATSPDGIVTYRGTIPCETSGRQGYTVRVVPAHPDANSILTTGLMTWY